MTPDQVRLVQDSFAMLVPNREQASMLFYQRLFDLDPPLRPMFSGSLPEQGRKLMQVLATIIHRLEHIESLLPSIDDLARRHVQYGVEERHYATVGEALLWTFDRLLGEAFDEATRDAWAAAYDLLSGRMIAAAYSAGDTLAA
jgi:nitric oxide dioxygenase